MFGVVMLLFVVAGLALSPIATASADTSSTDGSTQTTDSTAPAPDAPATDAPEPTTTTAPAPAATTVPDEPVAPDAPTTTTPPAPPATSAPAPIDDDSVTDGVEARAPHQGDNNQDGVADAEQANVASLPAAVDVDGNGSLDDYVTIVSPAGTSLHGVRAVAVPSDNPPPDGVSLPYGLFDYDVQVASPGDSAAVTYITPEGFVPDGVHFLQHGEWSDLADRTQVDDRTGDATVQLQDGGAGDESPAGDAVIADPSGVSTRDRSITVTVVSGAGAPNFTMKLESCPGSSHSLGSGGCSSNTAVPTTQGASNAAGESAALGNGAAWNWGGTPDSQLANDLRYRLSVSTPLPASGWALGGISCTGVNQQNGSSDLANARNIYLEDDSDARATCTATFVQSVASITVHKKGDRASDGSVNNLSGATFQVYSNATYTTAVPGATCVTGGTGTCVIGGLGTSTTYYVRETTAPSNFQRIDTLTTSADGSQIYGQAITTGGAGSNVNTRDFANRRTNPAFPSECGIDIALVMDLSNSIDSGELDDMKDAGEAFVTALQGTPSKVAGYTFATEAPAGGNSNLALTDVSSAAGADDARDWIDARTQPGGGAGGTNWDAGLRQVAGAAGSYDVVVFLTDGNPTFYGDPQSGGNGSSTTFREIEEGVFSSNQVKAANPALKMVGVAIGASASTNNIAAITGPTPNDDYFLAANFEDLQNKLEQIASQLCGGTVTVKKQVEGPGGFAPAGGWTFAVPGSTQGSGVTAAGTGVTPAFDVTPGTVTITETQQSGYTIVPQAARNASCTKNGSAVPANQITDTANGVSLAVGANDIVACEFRNTPAKATLEVRKQTSGGVGGAFTIQRTGNSAGSQNLNFTTSAGNNPTVFQSMSLFPGTYTLTETALPAGWAFDTVDCGTVNVGTKSTTLTLTAGQTVACTVSNKSTAGTIELAKTWAGALAGDAPTVNLRIGTSNGGTQVANQSVTGPAAGSTGAKNVGPGTYFVQESGLASGWLQTSLTCSTNSGAPVGYVPANGVAVPAGGSVVCTVTNTRQKGTIELTKLWSGGVAGEQPTTTLRIGTGSSGGAASNVASQSVTGLGTGTTGVKDVGIGTYFVSESGLSAGWTQGTLTCSVDGGASSPYVPANGIAVTNGKAVVCTVTNTRDAGSIELEKTWSGALGGDAPQVNLQIGSTNGGTNVANQSVTGPAAGTTGAQTVPTRTYFVQESGLASGWAQTSLTCTTNGGSPATYVPANGIAVPKNGTVVCTVTNTRQKGTLELRKVWSGGVAGEQPQTTLQIGTSGSPASVASQQVTGLSTGTTGAKTVGVGTYFVSETGLVAGWSPTGITCQNGAQAPVTYDPQAGIAIANGDDVVCTLTNTRQTGTVTVNKVWSGGAAGEQPKVNLVISGPSASSTQVTGLANGTTTPKTVVTGTYSASESNLAAGWTQTDASCVRTGNPGTFAPTSFVVSAGDAVICTITNTRDTGTITVDKTWVGGAQGDQPNANLVITGPSSSSTPVVGIAPSGTGPKQVATGAYTVGESGLSAGWHQQSITCQKGTEPPFTPTQGFTVAKGDSYVCTITNSKLGSITIVKDAKPNAAQDFGFTTGNLGGAFTLRDDGTSANTKVFPNLGAGSYSVTENANPAGWSLTNVSCVGAGGSGDTATRTATIQLPAGGNVTCTFTNTGPDVGIVKTDSPDPVQAGANLTYSLAVHNYGPPVAAPVSVSDTLPASTTFVSYAAGGGWSCTTPAVGATGTVSCSLASLAAGADAPVITVVVKVNAGVVPGTDVITNTATVTTPHDSNPSNDTSTATTSVVRSVDLKIVKSDGGATPTAGGAGFQYTLSVDNLGPSDASVAATVTDVIPAGISFVDYGSLPVGVTCDAPVGQTFTCTIPASLLDVADPAVAIPVNVAVPSTTAAGSYTNEVIVSSTDDPAPCTVTADGITCTPPDTNNYSQVTTPVQTKADLAIVKTVPATGIAGKNVTYTLDVSNLGPSDAADVVVDDPLPTGLSFVSASGSEWTCWESPAGTVHCTRPALAVGAAPPITVVAHVAPNVTGTVQNCATVTDAVDGDRNDTSCGDTNITPEVDVSIVKTDTPDPVVAGQNLTYDLAVANGGPSNASDVAVSDPLPAGTTFVSISAGAGWSCTTPAVGATGTISCSLASLPVGPAPSITVVVKVGAGVAPGTDVIVNTAKVTAPHDTNPDNDESTAKTSVIRVLDLAVTKSDGGAQPVAGDGEAFTYTITVDNLGPSDAGVAATVTDTLPAGVTFVAFGELPDGVDCTPPVAGVFTCTVAPSLLQVSDPAVVITLQVTVPASTPAGILTNTVVVTTPEEPCPGSPNCGNNTDETDTPVETSVDLTIRKSDGGAQPVSGVAGSNAFTYTLTVDNDGPSDASADATVTDVLPAGIDFVSYGTLPAGVSCSPPDGRTLTCTIAKGLLQVASPEVVILVNVIVPTTTPGGEVTNKVIVSNPDDEAPCTVTATDITCDPSDTNNYADVTTPIVQVAPDVVPTASPVQVEGASLAFTGSTGGRLALLGAAMVGFGALLVLAVRRRRRSGTS